MRVDLRSFVTSTLSADSFVTDGSSGADGGKLREESEMVRVRSIENDPRHDHSPLVTSEVKVDPLNFTVVT